MKDTAQTPSVRHRCRDAVSGLPRLRPRSGRTARPLRLRAGQTLNQHRPRLAARSHPMPCRAYSGESAHQPLQDNNTIEKMLL